MQLTERNYAIDEIEVDVAVAIEEIQQQQVIFHDGLVKQIVLLLIINICIHHNLIHDTHRRSVQNQESHRIGAAVTSDSQCQNIAIILRCGPIRIPNICPGIDILDSTTFKESFDDLVASLTNGDMEGISSSLSNYIHCYNRTRSFSFGFASFERRYSTIA